MTDETVTVDMGALERMIRPVVEAHGFELVRVALFHAPGLTLQVMLEDPATGQMLVDDCARVSRALSLLLDEADPIDSDYALEVSSPGIDRPLTRLKDFNRWATHVARLELAEPITLGGASRRRFQGPLIGAEETPDGGLIRLSVEGLGDVALPFPSIASAKLVLTDRLIAETRPLDVSGVDDTEVEEEPLPETEDLPPEDDLPPGGRPTD